MRVDPAVARLLVVGSLGRLPAAMLPLAVLVLVAGEASTTADGVAAGAVSLGLGASGVLTGRWLDGGAAHRVIAVLAVAHLPAVGAFLVVADGGPTAAVAGAAFVAGSSVPPIGSLVRARLTGAVPESDHRRVFALESVTVELVWIAGPLLVSLLAVLTDRWVAVAASGLAVIAGSIGMMTGLTNARSGGGHGGSGPWLSGPVVRLIVAFAVVGAGFNVAMVGLAERAKQVDATELTGLLIGGAVPFLFSGLAIQAVSRTAGVVVQEVRNQFADGKIMKGEKRPDYAPVIDICTAASLRELATPALLAVLMPVVVGFGLGYLALGGYLAAIIVVGALMANFLSNAGGAWDNGKKYIEEGNLGGKGSDVHKAVVIGDTVGDPFKDTAGPAISPLIKVMNLVSLLILPAIISLDDNQGLRYAIALVALAIVLASVVYSKRQETSFGDDAADDAATATADA
ncbi:MAG: sodium/proton-translocating pyrophosphatase [Crocinitomicaceae bacterium]